MKSVVTSRSLNHLRTAFAVNLRTVVGTNVFRNTPEYEQIE